MLVLCYVFAQKKKKEQIYTRSQGSAAVAATYADCIWTWSSKWGALCTEDSHLGLVVPGLRLLIRITAVGSSYVGAGRSVVSSSLPPCFLSSYLLPRLPLSFSALARFASRHCAHSLPESIPSKLYEATQLLLCPRGGRRCVRALGQGGSGLRTDGQPARGFPLLICWPFTRPSPLSPRPPEQKTGWTACEGFHCQ